MSANNFIKISRRGKKFMVENLDIETHKGFEIGKYNRFIDAYNAALLEEAEYGISYADVLLEEIDRRLKRSSK